MDKSVLNEICVIAFDLDGTLTQHKTPLSGKNRAFLDKLKQSYTLLMVGAGQSRRIFRQMGSYPIDIIGNYGMQFCHYDSNSEELKTVYDDTIPCNRESVAERIKALREKYGYTVFKGDSVEYHASGCVTFPLLGTAADIEDKLAFDPDRSKRRVIYQDIKAVFSDFSVFIGGSSSFDFAPAPYNKYYALDRYCRDNSLRHSNILYCGDDYGLGGNDEAVYQSDIPFVCVDDYTRVEEIVKETLTKT